jgi:hypothetical protein
MFRLDSVCKPFAVFEVFTAVKKSRSSGEDGGSKVLPNVGILRQHDTAS